MRRLILSFACAGMFALAGTMGMAGGAQAGVSADINLHVGDRRAPVVVFDREPDVVLVPRTRVYYVSGLDYDLFRYGRHWYINDGGYWFRARHYRGPFVAVAYERVPRTIFSVPARYHRHPWHPHGGPPGQMKKGRAMIVEDRDGDVRVIKRGKKHKGR